MEGPLGGKEAEEVAGMAAYRTEGTSGSEAEVCRSESVVKMAYCKLGSEGEACRREPEPVAEVASCTLG